MGYALNILRLLLVCTNIFLYAYEFDLLDFSRTVGNFVAWLVLLPIVISAHRFPCVVPDIYRCIASCRFLKLLFKAVFHFTVLFRVVVFLPMIPIYFCWFQMVWPCIEVYRCISGCFRWINLPCIFVFYGLLLWHASVLMIFCFVRVLQWDFFHATIFALRFHVSDWFYLLPMVLHCVRVVQLALNSWWWVFISFECFHLSYVRFIGFPLHSDFSVGFTSVLMILYWVCVLPFGYVVADGLPLNSGRFVGFDLVLMVFYFVFDFPLGYVVSDSFPFHLVRTAGFDL